MDKADENPYVSQLSEVFNSCDTTGTGYLDKEELTELCRKLHLEAQLPVLLQTLLGNDHFARVNFEEFKEGFVAVLSQTIDLSLSEDQTSYLQPVIPEEVKPKFVKGTKRYGRRSRPEVQATNVENSKHLQEHQTKGKRKNKLRRSASLESVESLKSEEEAESAKDPPNETFEAQGQMRSWNPDIFDSPGRASSPCSDMTENQVRDIWEELDVGNNGYLNKLELATVCKNIGLKDLKSEEIEDLFNKLDQDGDGRVSFKEFQLGLFSHGPSSLPISSTPFRQKRQWSLSQAFEESGRTPSLLSSCGGLHLFSSIDDGTGFVNAEQVLNIWEQEGLYDCKEILKTLDFSLEEPVNLVDLALALDKEMSTTPSRVQQAGLASYRQELQHVRAQVEQISKEKEKVKKDCERAEMRNRQLTSEVDDHHSVMEILNQSKISDLEQDYKEKVVAIRSELLKESELFMQQADHQRTKLEADVFAMQREDSVMREKLTLCLKENSRLQKEMMEMVEKASESKKLAVKLQNDLDMVLNERLRLMDPQSTGHFDQEERFAEIIREYEMQCRELRDRNDELEVELEKLRSQLNEYKNHNMHGRRKDLKQLLLKSKINSNLNADNLAKNKLSLKLGRSSSTVGVNGVVSKEIVPTALSIEAELTKEQLKEHQQQVQDLRIQLETKVNYYEREIELMKQNFEQERKDTEQGFKMEVSELEEQKSGLEELNTKLEEVVSGLKDQLQKSAQSQEIEKRFERERAEMEQNYAQEISNLAQSLSQEREQLEEELKRNHQYELQATRNEVESECNQKLAQAEAQYSENVKVLLHQHQCELDNVVKSHAEELERMKETHIQEKKQWGEKEAKIVMENRKEKLKYEERLHEDQARICKTFAIEKETLENSYREQIESLSLEVENLKTCLFEAKRDYSKLNSLYVATVNTDSSTRIPNHLEGSPGLNDDQFSKSQHPSPQEQYNDSVLLSWAEGDQAGIKTQMCKEKARKVESDLQFKLEEKENLLQGQSKQMEDKHFQETKNSIMGQLRLKEDPLPSEESTLNLQLSPQLHAKEEQLQTFKNKVEDLISELEQSSQQINVQESKLQELAKERDILFEQARYSEEYLEQLRVVKEELLKQQSIFETVKKEKDEIIAQKRDLLESCTREKEEQSKQLRNLEKELSDLRRSEENALEQLKLNEEEVTICLHQAQREFEEEKIELKDKLLHLEHLVHRLETETGLDDRIELNRLSEDNGVLRNKIELYEQEVCTAAAEITKQRENSEKFKNEIIVLSQQNMTFEDELGQLTTKNLQLGDIISDLCAKAQDNENTIQLLNAKLAEITHQKEDESAVAMKLQETVASLEKRQLQHESAWLRERGRATQEMHLSRETVANMTFQHQLLQQEKEELRREVEENKKQMATLTVQHQLIQQEKEDLMKKAGKDEERIHSLEAELQRVNLEFQTLREREARTRKELLESQDQVTQMHRLEAELQRLNQECQTLRLKDTQIQEQLVASQDQVKHMHILEAELQRVNLECQAFREKEAEIRQELVEFQDQLLEANTRLTLAESQHMREVQNLKEKVFNAVSKDQLDKLQAKLLEAQEKIHQLQEKLRLQAEQAKRQLAQQLEDHEKLLRRMEEKMLEVEMNLKTVRLMLQEKVKQLKEQLEKNAKSDLLLKDLYVENAQLMKALQVTEQRQKTAEKKNFILDEKIAALNKLIRNIAPASLSA